MRLLDAVLISVGLTVVTLLAGTRAQADVSGVSLFVNAPVYSGSCPVDIVFTAIVTGDPGTTFGHRFSGAGFSPSKTMYGFIPDSGSISIDDSITVDAVHAGSFDRQVEITAYVRAVGGSMFPAAHIKSNPIAFSVTCAVSPGSTPTAGATPVPSPAH